jgi:hypothetical protein
LHHISYRRITVLPFFFRFVQIDKQTTAIIAGDLHRMEVSQKSIKSIYQNLTRSFLLPFPRTLILTQGCVHSRFLPSTHRGALLSEERMVN